jgi:hypothetical protein
MSIIFLSGMAHSGTTILTHLLRQHPSVYHQIDGKSVMFYESDLIFDSKSLNELVLNNFGKKVLVKKPWVFGVNPNYFIDLFPDAYFICCLKSFEEASKSWSKPYSQVAFDFRYNNVAQKEKYDLFMESVYVMKNSLNKFKIVYYDEFIGNSLDIMKELTEFLEIDNFNYDLSDVGNDKNIKVIIN